MDYSWIRRAGTSEKTKEIDVRVYMHTYQTSIHMMYVFLNNYYYLLSPAIILMY